MRSDQWKYFAAMFLIGDGVFALARPRRDARAWHVGPRAWQRAMQYLGQRPALLRSIGAVEAGLALWWASSGDSPSRG